MWGGRLQGKYTREQSSGRSRVRGSSSRSEGPRAAEGSYGPAPGSDHRPALRPQDCCSCCSLGLRLRSEGRGCDAQRYLGFRCRHAFLTCCRGDEWRPERLGVREGPALEPTAPPAKGISRGRS